MLTALARTVSSMGAALCVFSGVAVAPAGAAYTGAPQGRAGYAVTDLGALGGSFSEAFSVNDRREVTGIAETTLPDTVFGGNQWHAFLWRSGRMTDLGTLGGPNSLGRGVNERGDVVGTSELAEADPQTGYPATHAFRWSDGRMADLGTIAGATHSVAWGINNHRVVVGISFDVDVHVGAHDPESNIRGFVGTRRGLAELPIPAGHVNSEATAINDSGLIAGAVFTTSQMHPIVWQRHQGAYRPLPLPLPPDFDQGLTYGVNDRGDVVGVGVRVTQCPPGSPTPQVCESGVAMLWRATGRTRWLPVMLGTLPGGDDHAVGRAINNARVIVGQSQPPLDSSRYERAFVYDQATMRALQDLLVSDTRRVEVVRDVNNRGDIAGIATDGNQSSAVLMSPVRGQPVAEAPDAPGPYRSAEQGHPALSANGMYAGVKGPARVDTARMVTAAADGSR